MFKKIIGGAFALVLGLTVAGCDMPTSDASAPDAMASDAAAVEATMQTAADELAARAANGLTLTNPQAKITLNGDGSMDLVLGSDSFEGTWSVENGQFCREVPALGDRVSGCVDVTRKADGYDIGGRQYSAG